MADARQQGQAVARVYNRDHIHTLGNQIGGGAQAVIVVGENRHTLTGDDTPAICIGADCTSQHDAGAIIVLKGNRAFNGPGSQDRAFGIDAPKDLAGFARLRGGQMVRDTLNRGINPVIQRAKDRGARQQAHVRHLGQFGNSAGRPVGTGLIPQHVGFCVQPPAHAEVFICQDHPRARPCSGHRGGKPCGASADDEKVAVQEPFVVGIGIILF